MGVTRKYIRGRIYVPSEKYFQICDLHEASRRARVDSSVEMERTDAGCVGGHFQYAYLQENSEHVIFSEGEEGRKRDRERERGGDGTERKGKERVNVVQMGRWGVANFIECEFARPTLFPVINLVARGTMNSREDICLDVVVSSLYRSSYLLHVSLRTISAST